MDPSKVPPPYFQFVPYAQPMEEVQFDQEKDLGTTEEDASTFEDDEQLEDLDPHELDDVHPSDITLPTEDKQKMLHLSLASVQQLACPSNECSISRFRENQPTARQSTASRSSSTSTSTSGSSSVSTNGPEPVPVHVPSADSQVVEFTMEPLLFENELPDTLEATPVRLPEVPVPLPPAELIHLDAPVNMESEQKHVTQVRNGWLGLLNRNKLASSSQHESDALETEKDPVNVQVVTPPTNEVLPNVTMNTNQNKAEDEKMSTLAPSTQVESTLEKESANVQMVTPPTNETLPMANTSTNKEDDNVSSLAPPTQVDSTLEKESTNESLPNVNTNMNQNKAEDDEKDVADVADERNNLTHDEPTLLPKTLSSDESKQLQNEIYSALFAPDEKDIRRRGVHTESDRIVDTKKRDQSSTFHGATSRDFSSLHQPNNSWCSWQNAIIAVMWLIFMLYLIFGSLLPSQPMLIIT